MLICQCNQSQNVGKLAETLKANKDERADIHPTINRPWESYTTLLKSETYLIKQLTINPHQRISPQDHHHRSEHWVIINSTAEITKGENTSLVNTGENTFIPAKTVHRLANNTNNPPEVAEVQEGEPLPEDNIVRSEDDFEWE